MNLDFLPWVEKYRPKYLNQIISNNENINILTSMLKNGSLPHLLFHGTSGTGKTSLIQALALELYGNNLNLMVMKLDASDDRGINSVREEIKGFAEKKNMFYKGVKLIILDEADSMTFDAQFALRRIIEKYSETTRFCLICNYENKIIPAIRSRCANFRFNPIYSNDTILLLEKICINENLTYTHESLDIIANLCNGDLRKSINLLQSISMKTSNITIDMSYESAGLPSLENINIIFEYLINQKYDFQVTYNTIYNIIKLNGYSLGIILKEITNLLLKKELLDSKYYAQIFSDLSNIENKVSKSTFDDIYISSFISIFKKLNSNILE
jgi:replication factor C subunit 3/5